SDRQFFPAGRSALQGLGRQAAGHPFRTRSRQQGGPVSDQETYQAASRRGGAERDRADRWRGAPTQIHDGGDKQKLAGRYFLGWFLTGGDTLKKGGGGDAAPITPTTTK